MKSEPMPRYLLGTMFDTTRVVERELSTGTIVRLRIQELDGDSVLVHEARRRRGAGSWTRWSQMEGEQPVADLRLDLCREVGPQE